MLKISTSNSEIIADNLPAEYKVLDVGGSSAPFQRADFIIDVLPYSKIQWSQKRGASDRRLIEKNYVQHDICSREPWPFDDKQFDYVFCSHVLEDIRDPIWVCSELIRVSKAGYIEIPSKLFETTFGLEAKGLAGATHHRWVIDVHNQKLRFTFKFFHIHYPFINNNRQHLNQDNNAMLLRIEWENDFEYFENWLLSGKDIFEYFLDKPISENEKWNIYRKLSPKNYFSAWLRYLKNTSEIFNKIYLRIKR